MSTKLPADVLAAFWDLENVPVPSGISPTRILMMVREEFGKFYEGLEFNIFCNVFHAEEEIIAELLKENITLLHVQKNSSKDKLRFMLKRFLSRREFGSLKVVLISDDIKLNAIIAETVQASAVSVILVHTLSALGSSLPVSVGRWTSFFKFIKGLCLIKHAFLPLKYKQVPYDLWAVRDIEVPDFHQRNELHYSGLSLKEQEGHRGADTLRTLQSTCKIAAKTEEVEAKIELPNDYTEERTSALSQKEKLNDDQANDGGDTAPIFSAMQLSPLRECTSSGTKASDVVKDHQAKMKARKERAALVMDVEDTKSRGLVSSVNDSTESYEHHLGELDQASSDSPLCHQAQERYTPVEVDPNVKSKLRNLLNKQKVVLLVSSPGSGIGLEAAACAQKLGHRVLSIQPTDTEARLCATYSESCRKLTNVDCWLFHGQRVSPRASVVFTSAPYFFQLFQNTGKEAAGFQTIIVDGINEDNIYQRVNMKILLRCLQSGVTLVFCCRGSDIPISLQEAFYVEADNILNCDDFRFPVHVIWKEPSQGKLCTCIEAILEYCAKESPDGDIVVFVTTVEEAFKAKASLQLRLLKEGRQESFICEVMYAGMVPLQTIEASSNGIWKVYFTVNCPDVTASAMRIRCIVDCGLVSETAFESGIFVKEFRPICPAEAEERRSLAALHGEGTCYRVYSESEFLSSLPSASNNLRYIEDVVLRLLARNTEATAFLQDEVPKQALQEAKRGLQEIGAIDKKGQVTEVGLALCLLSSEPRLGKLILGSLGRLRTQDAVLLSTVAFEDLRSAYQSFSEGCVQSVVPSSKCRCEVSHLIELYKKWCDQPTKERSSWCTVKELNNLFFEHWHAKTTCAYSEFLNFRTGKPLERLSVEPEYGVVTIANVLSECFPNGLLQVTKQGCQHTTLGKDIKLSSFSLLRNELQTNDTAICWLFSRGPGSKVLQVLNACILRGSRNGSAFWNFSYGAEMIYVYQQVVPIGSLIWDGQFSDLHIAQFLEKQLHSVPDTRKAEGSLVPDVARQRVLLEGTNKYCFTVWCCLQRSIRKQLKELKQADREAVLTTVLSPFERRPVLAIVGEGGVVLDVMSSAAFRTIVVRDVLLPVAEIERQFQELGSVVKFESENGGNVISITYRTAEAANAAYNYIKNQRCMDVEVKGQALVCRNQLAERRAPFHLVVSMRHQGEPLSGSTEIPVQECFDRVSCVKQLGIPNEGYKLQEIDSSKQSVPEFASTSTLSSLGKDGVEKPSVDIKSEIPAPRAKHGTIASEWDIVCCNITKLLNMKLSPEMPEFRAENPMSPDRDMKGLIFFRTIEAADRALKLLSGEQHSLYVDSAPTGPPKLLAIEVFMEVIFCIPRTCFVAIEGKFLEKIFLMKKNNPKEGPDYEASTYGNLVVLKLRAKDSNELMAAVNFLSVFLQEKKILRQQDFPVHPGHVEEVVKAVAHPSDVYQDCQTVEIPLAGDDEAARDAVESFWNHRNAKEEFSTEILGLVFEKFTRLRSFLASYGDDLRKFAMECGLCHAKFYYTLKSIEVFGSSEAITKAKALVQNLQAEKVVRPTPLSTEECCSVCHLPPQGSTRGHTWLRGWHRLTSCGHLHCVPCLILAVKWAALPLTCFHKNCASLWVVADVSKVTVDKPAMLTALARRSLQHNIAKKADVPWRPCPIPECAFVWNTNDSAESQGIQVYGALHVCPACTNPVCFVCQSLFHFGRPCRNKESAQSKKGGVPTPKPGEIDAESRQSLRTLGKRMKRHVLPDTQEPSSVLPEKGSATRRQPCKADCPEMGGPTATTPKNIGFPKPGKSGEESLQSLRTSRKERKRTFPSDIQGSSSAVSDKAATRRQPCKSDCHEMGGPTATTPKNICFPKPGKSGEESLQSLRTSRKERKRTFPSHIQGSSSAVSDKAATRCHPSKADCPEKGSPTATTRKNIGFPKPGKSGEESLQSLRTSRKGRKRTFPSDIQGSSSAVSDKAATSRHPSKADCPEMGGPTATTPKNIGFSLQGLIPLSRQILQTSLRRSQRQSLRKRMKPNVLPDTQESSSAVSDKGNFKIKELRVLLLGRGFDYYEANRRRPFSAPHQGGRNSELLRLTKQLQDLL